MSNSTYSQARVAASTMASRVFSRVASGPGPPRWAEINGQLLVTCEEAPSVPQAERAHPGAVRRGDPLDEPADAGQVTGPLDDQRAQRVPLGDHRLRAADRLAHEPPGPQGQPARDLLVGQDGGAHLPDGELRVPGV